MFSTRNNNNHWRSNIFGFRPWNLLEHIIQQSEGTVEGNVVFIALARDYYPDSQ